MIEQIVTKKMARRYFENINNKIGERHAFMIALFGDEFERKILNNRIIEFNNAFPDLSERENTELFTEQIFSDFSKDFTTSVNFELYENNQEE